MSGFLDLPPELRVRIYNFAFTDNLRYQNTRSGKLDRRVCGLKVLGIRHTARYEAAPLLRLSIEAKLKIVRERGRANVLEPKSREEAETYEAEAREAEVLGYLEKEIRSALLLRVGRTCRHYGMGEGEDGIWACLRGGEVVEEAGDGSAEVLLS